MSAMSGIRAAWDEVLKAAVASHGAQSGGCLVVCRANDNNIQLLWKERQLSMYVSNITEEVADVALVLVLNTLMPTNFDEGVNLGNTYLLDWRPYWKL
jgi:hypothetical protein